MSEKLSQSVRPLVATPEQAAEFLQVSRSTVYELVRLGELPSIKVRRCRRIPWAAIERLAQEGTAVRASDSQERSDA